jgi:two-component system, NarL family, sensor histidine kinase UhpB
MAAKSERDQQSDTSLERMVAAMREGAARLNGIVQSAMDAIITVDEHQNIVIFNPASEQMFGCASADVLSTPLEQFIPSRLREAHRTHIDRFGATGVSTRRMGVQSEIVGLRANGEEFPVEASISQVSVGGKKLFTVILRDITARKRAEEAARKSAERYQRLIELVPEAIWIERDDRIVFLNRACVQLLAGDSVVHVLGKSPLEFIHPDFHAVATERRQRVMAGLEPNPLMDKQIVRLDGEVRDVEIAETSFHDEGGFGLLAVLRDVTERKRTEREVRESREQLRQLSASLQAVREEEKARIARELHDELGQALTGLKMDLAQLVTQLAPEQLGAIGQANAMKALIESTVASVRRIATELRPLMLDDLGLLSTIEWLVNDFSRRTGIAVEVILPEPEFEVDRELSTALFRVLQESLTNVARHAGANRVCITLSGTESDVQLTVHDNGKGIGAALESAPKTFGLLGMRERASMLGGELAVRSNPGNGTSIVMIVPRQAGATKAPL